MDITVILQYAKWLPVVIVGLGVLIGFFAGMMRGLAKTTVHFVMLCVRAVGAVILTRVLLPIIVPAIMSAAAGAVKDNTVAEILQDPAFVDIATALFGMLLGGLLFFCLFIALVIIIKPIEWIISSLIKQEHKIRFFGGLLGLVSGFVLVSLLMMPLAGLIHVVVPVVQKTGMVDPTDVYMNTVAEIDDSDICRIQRIIGGEQLFRYVSSAKYGDGEVCLVDEAEVMSNIASETSVLAQNNDLSTWGDKEINAVKTIANKMGESNLIPQFIKTMFSSVNEAWKNDKAFIGVKKPELPEAFEPTLMLTVDTFGNSSTENIGKSISALADVVDILNKNGVLAYMADSDNTSDATNIASKLSENNLMEQIVECLNKDENLKVIVPEIRNVVLRLIAQSIGIPEIGEEVIGGVINDFADIYNSALSEATPEEQIEKISDGINNISSELGFEIPEYEREEIAKAFVEQFAGEGEISAEQMADWFRQFLGTTAE